MPCHTLPPRPILKRPSSSSPSSSPPAYNTTHNTDGGSHHHHHHHHHNNNNNFNHHHAVHFPPTPSLTSTFSAYSSAAYDRSPIVIAPNACTLPARGCPGRTYYSADDYSRSRGKHPRAFASDPSSPSASAAHPGPMVVGSCPPLIPDLSSESEESDGFASPYSEPSRSASPHVYCANGLPVNMPRHDLEYFPGVSIGGGTFDPEKAAATTTTLDTPTALSFLPYPPSPLIRSAPYLTNDEEEETSPSTPTNAAKHRRRRHSRERDSGNNNNNSTPNAGEAQHPQRERRSKSSCRTKSSDRAVSISFSSTSSFGLQDDGCLGGF